MKKQKDPRFKQIAMLHTDTVMEYFVRPDGSVRHIVEFDPNTGMAVRDYGGQGYEEGSSWTRGQAWGNVRFPYRLSPYGEKKKYFEYVKKELLIIFWRIFLRMV